MQKVRHNPFALVVEDHPLVTESLVACIRACDPELEVLTADSLRAALRVLAQRPAPLLIISDLTLIDSEGTATVRGLREAAPASPLLVVTAIDDAHLRREAIELGVVRYVIKSTSTAVLRHEIQLAIDACPNRERHPPAAGDGLNHLLTRKQLAVLEELAAGRSNKEIALRMNIGDETVATHVKEILCRLAVRNRTEAVVRYLQIIKAS